MEAFLKEENATDREIVLSRAFDAPRELVFDCFSDPQLITLWWGPRGFMTITDSMEFRPGGVWLYTMHGPDGTEYPNRVVYREISRPERLVYDHGASEDDPAQFRVTVTFEKEGRGTRITMRSLFDSVGARDYVVREYGAIEGGKQTLERLAEIVRELV